DSATRWPKGWRTSARRAPARARTWPNGSGRSAAKPEGEETAPGGRRLFMATAVAADGHVVQIIGTVIDIEFPPDALPAINSAFNSIRDDATPLVTEVQQPLGNNWVRCLAMDTTDGLRRQARAVNTGEPI